MKIYLLCAGFRRDTWPIHEGERNSSQCRHKEEVNTSMCNTISLYYHSYQILCCGTQNNCIHSIGLFNPFPH